MSLSSTLLLLLIIASCCVTVPLVSAEVIKSDFTIFTQNGTFELLNSHRPGVSKLKFSIVGANITNQTERNHGYSLRANMSDGSEMYVDQMSFVSDPDFTWYQVAWTGLNESANLKREFCFHYGLNNASWYSTYENSRSWPMDPLESVTRAQSLTTGDEFGSVVEYLFVNSDGFAVMLFDWDAWYLRKGPNQVVDRLLCVSSENRYSDRSQYSMVLHIISAKNIREVHKFAHNRAAWLPTTKYAQKKIPEESLFKNPIWSTKAHLKEVNLNQTKVLEYANEIKKHGFSVNQIEIHNQWQKHHGDLVFDSTNFPDPKKMIEELHKLGFKVALSVNSFVNKDSSTFKNSQYFSTSKTDHKPLNVKFLNTEGALINFSNSSAVQWFVNRLVQLQTELKLDSFAFDVGGEVSLYEPDSELVSKVVQEKPNLLSYRYAHAASQLNASSVESAFRNQDLPIFVRMSKKESNWSGLKSLIRAALTLSIGGYSFILPDAIDGNATEELYIRWVQTNTFLPSMQFLIPPWVNSSDSTVNITQKYVQLHLEHAPTLIALAKRDELGEPIIRPMWYAAPDDPRAFTIADQYMLGEDILVAPVVEEKQTERTVFLPPGTWLDQHGKSYEGSSVVKVAAPLEELPYFKRKV